MKIKLRTFIFLLFITPIIAHALNVETYKKYSHLELGKIYVSGLGGGFEWANAALESNNQKPLFCVPNKLALTQDNYLNILEDAIKETKNSNDMLIEPMLLIQLKKTFPCK